MSFERRLAATRRAFLICHFLRWLPAGLVIPIMVLLLTERGLSLTQVGLVFAVYGGITSLLELPTGGLADALGRRPVLLMATAFDASLVVGLLLGRDVWHFLAVAAVGAVGRALLSGPLESWYVDSARGLDPAIVLRPALSAAGMVESAAIGLGALLSAVLPLVATGLPLDGLVSLLTLPVPGVVIAQIAAVFVAQCEQSAVYPAEVLGSRSRAGGDLQRVQAGVVVRSVPGRASPSSTWTWPSIPPAMATTRCDRGVLDGGHQERTVDGLASSGQEIVKVLTRLAKPGGMRHSGGAAGGASTPLRCAACGILVRRALVPASRDRLRVHIPRLRGLQRSGHVSSTKDHSMSDERNLTDDEIERLTPGEPEETAEDADASDADASDGDATDAVDGDAADADGTDAHDA